MDLTENSLQGSEGTIRLLSPTTCEVHFYGSGATLIIPIAEMGDYMDSIGLWGSVGGGLGWTTWPSDDHT